jgi:hypothetical protein
MELRSRFEDVGRWLWVAALVACAVGVIGLVDLGPASLPKKLILLAPHLAGVGLTILGGRWCPTAAVVGLVGSVIMAGLTWWDALDRQTEGFEWRFNNEIGAFLCLGANNLVLTVVACVVSLLCAAVEQPDDDAYTPKMPG